MARDVTDAAVIFGASTTLNYITKPNILQFYGASIVLRKPNLLNFFGGSVNNADPGKLFYQIN